MSRPWLANGAIAFALFLANFGLNTPLFMPGDAPYRDSIEAGYASMASFVAAHPDPWGWNPTQYCGLPLRFVYVPMLPYATALAARIVSAEPEYIYRLITATMLCLGPAAVFLFVVYFARSRVWALAAALACTFFSPLYGMAAQIDADRGIVQLPWRVQVYVKYGEGPHNTGLTLLPLALIAAWGAAIGRRYWRVLLAAVLLAAIALTNWVAALATGVCCLLMMACGIATERSADFRAWRILAAAALAWLLACFWLTPSFIQTVFFNWPKDAWGYVAGHRQAVSAVGLAAVVLVARYLLLRARCAFYTCFVTLAALVFGWIVLGHYWFKVSLIPESRRYATEFELFLILALVEWIRVAWMRKDVRVRAVAAVAAGALVAIGLPQARKYVLHDRAVRYPLPLDKTIEYPLAKWLAGRPINGRVFASGGLRFRLNSWFEVPQVGGGFESGLANRVPIDLAYQIRTAKADTGRGPADLLSQLRTLGVEYVVVHGPQSREHYRDYTKPERFRAVLSEVYRIEDDTIYHLPVTSLAHLVAPEELPDWRLWPPHLDAYAAAIGDPARPKLATAWHGTNVLEIGGPVPEGRLVSVQVNWDPGWAAYQDGRPLKVEKDKLGFVLLRPDPAPAARIVLRYESTLEPRVMAAVSVTAWFAALSALFLTRRRAGA